MANLMMVSFQHIGYKAAGRCHSYTMESHSSHPLLAACLILDSTGVSRVKTKTILQVASVFSCSTPTQQNIRNNMFFKGLPRKGSSG